MTPFKSNFKIVLSISHQTGYHNYNEETDISNAITKIQIITNNDTTTVSFISNPDAKYYTGHAINDMYHYSRITSIKIDSFEII